jgi:ATP-dependent Lon protease
MPKSGNKYNLRNKNYSKKKEDSSSEDESEYETASSSEETEQDSSYHNSDTESNSKHSNNSSEEESDDGKSELSGSDHSKRDFEFKKLLSKMFPSKYMSKKVKDNKKLKSLKQKYFKKYESENKKKLKSKKHVSESEEESDYSDDERYKQEQSKNYGIIMSIDMSEDDYEDDEDEYLEEENEVCNSEDEETFMKEKYEKLEVPITYDKKSKSKKDSNKKDKSKNNSVYKRSDIVSKEDKEGANKEEVSVENKYLELVEIKKSFVEQLKKHPNNKILSKSLERCNEDIRKMVKDARTKNAMEYSKMLMKTKIQTNEIEYFKKKLSNKEQMNIMTDLKEINNHIYIDKPYRLALLQSNIPPQFKAIAMQKLNMMRSMDPSHYEYYKIKNWIDTFMKIPFGVYRNISVSINDGIDVCHDFMYNAINTLDKCVYGLNDAKLQIMQMIGQWIANPNAMGTAIAIHGPPGTGKTSIVKDGISKILGREFAFIALGGSGDSSFLEGHSYTYEGSTWGKIVQILINSKCMNPVIYFDELDKVSETPRGQEIIGILTHLTDTTQNTQFHDKYFAEIDFDLSKCLFIFSYNDEMAVNPILKDRMYRIQTKGYDMKEKVKIARDYLLPKIREQVKFKDEDVIIPDDTLTYLISNTRFTNNESGVRNLKRCLEIIHTKLNLFRLMKPDMQLFDKDMNMKVEFPIQVTRKEVDILIKNEEKLNPSLLAMYI